jgi:hypothetical protein
MLPIEIDLVNFFENFLIGDDKEYPIKRMAK